MMRELTFIIGAFLALEVTQIRATPCDFTIMQNCGNGTMPSMEQNSKTFCKDFKSLACCVGKAARNCPTVKQQFLKPYTTSGSGANFGSGDAIMAFCNFNITSIITYPDTECTESPSKGDKCNGQAGQQAVNTCLGKFKNTINMDKPEEWACPSVKPLFCCIAHGMPNCPEARNAAIYLFTAPSLKGKKSLNQITAEKCKINGVDIIKKPSETCGDPSSTTLVMSSGILMLLSAMLACIEF